MEDPINMNRTIIYNPSNKKMLIQLFFYAFIAVFFASNLMGQRILDSQTLLPINNVALNNNKGISCQSDSTGNISHCLFSDNDIITIEHEGYPTISYVWEYIKKQKHLLFRKKIFELDEVNITGYGFNELKHELPAKVDQIGSSWIDFHQPQTTADALGKSGILFVQRSQMGGGSPTIRGFEANRVLIVVDGIRMNNAIFRGGHLQNIIRNDVQFIDHIDIISGPSSVYFGSDAMGGVMHIQTIDPPMLSGEKGVIKGKVMARWGGANLEKTIHAQLGFAKKKWRFLTGFTFSHYDDLRQGSWIKSSGDSLWRRNVYVERINNKDSVIVNPDPYIQKLSGYYQYNILQKISYTSNKGIQHKLNIQFSNSSNVNRYDRLTELTSDTLPRFAEWYYGPETRVLAGYNITLPKSKWFDQSEISFSYQYFAESRHSRKLQKKPMLNQNEQVHMARFAVDFWKKIQHHRLQFGLEGIYNYVQSTSFYKDIVSLDETPAPTRYPGGGSHYYTAGLYLTDNWKLTNHLFLQVGGRVGFTGLNASFTDTTFFPFPYTSTSFNHVTGSGNIGLSVHRNWLNHFTFMLSTGFRSPNVDDLGKVFDSRVGSIIVPNINLKPEYTFNAELGFEFKIAKQALIQVNGFGSYAYGLMQVMPFLYNGLDSIMYNGEMSQVTALQNASYGWIAGASAQFIWYPVSFFYISGSVNYTWGIVRDSADWMPLDHIPPIYGRSAVGVRFAKISAEMYVLFNAKKPVSLYNPYGEDNIKYATPQGMPGWATLNIKTSFDVHPKLSIQLGIENILNQQYRIFSSGISSPGISVFMTINSRF